MKEHKRLINYPEFNCASNTPCTICGKFCEQQFKRGFVCEDCLIYVRTQY